MSKVRFEGRDYALEDGESVLDALLRHGVPLTYSCKAGVCGSCMMRAVSGSLPARAQSGLKDSRKLRGCFLACSCVPTEDLELADAGGDFRVGARIASLEDLGAAVVRVTLVCDTPLEFKAGQYVTVVREDGLARSYSLANLPGEGTLELHVRRVPNGQMSGWFHTEAKVGDRLTLLGPHGECFYVEGRPEQSLLLAGAGTGLAPLLGIVRDALSREHRGPVHLFHGALQQRGLYLVEELKELARRHPQFYYTAVVLEGTAREALEVGPVDRVVLSRFPDLTGWRGFVCGDPNFVRDLKQKFFLAEMASRDIYADAFIPAAAR
jgi:NAD(P)H-flavin reductase/ferredoxin